MTVKELRKILEDLPDDAEIKYATGMGETLYMNDWWMEDGDLILG